MDTTKKILYIVCQWTWGIAQNIIGLAIFLALINNRHSTYKGALVTHWKLSSCMGCGMFIFMGGHGSYQYSKVNDLKVDFETLIHEYGHTIQSIILGPLFIPVIAIPSLMWASLPCLIRFRRKRGLSYYWLYCEKWANILGDKFCRDNKTEDKSQH